MIESSLIVSAQRAERGASGCAALKASACYVRAVERELHFAKDVNADEAARVLGETIVHNFSHRRPGRPAGGLDQGGNTTSRVPAQEFFNHARLTCRRCARPFYRSHYPCSFHTLAARAHTQPPPPFAQVAVAGAAAAGAGRMPRPCRLPRVQCYQGLGAPSRRREVVVRCACQGRAEAIC